MKENKEYPEAGNKLETPIGQKDWLEAMELRAVTQKIVITQFNVNIVMFTMNIPGPIKSNPIIQAIFQEGLMELLKRCECYNPIAFLEKNPATGPEAYILVPITNSCLTVKKDLLSLENQHPMGRWFDIDVISEKKTKISRSDLKEPPRRCFLCDKPAKICRREGNHSIDELFAYTIQQMQSYVRETHNDTKCFELF
ncbi:citrate lyase holo-[acyl-carrier protein] synthase [uncultured Sphaerochaeta sp.]|uniref:citrate lyase holo-[acyl-carrier protein] synthase n=1 Tax=uncultured Sphaerochaeta sp. TaxID=886478 RepID=UPI002A0A9E42|nr:citrate lyase holo-[acyl-carrier protein] synthase [uncultured Sphaerochaeta sp.]